MSTENVQRGLGDNSKINDVKESYNTWGEILKEVTTNILTLSNKITSIQDMHKASHGHEYYFADECSNEKDFERYPGTTPKFGNTRKCTPFEKKDEIDETKSSAVLNNYVYGVTRKCTPFEKKDFAGRANQELDNAHSVAMDNYGKLMNIRKKLEEVADE